MRVMAAMSARRQIKSSHNFVKARVQVGFITQLCACSRNRHRPRDERERKDCEILVLYSVLRTRRSRRHLPTTADAAGWQERRGG